jgi:plastocyanin
MRRAVLAIALAGLAATAGPARAQEHPGASPRAMHRATIGFGAVTPARLDVVTGDTVTWTNESARAHTVTADDGSFDSGRMATSQRFSRAFGAPREVPYHCTLHPFIRGVVAASDLLLDAPAQPASPNRPYPLSGRSALAAGTPVSLEADTGVGFAEVARTTVGPDGAFSARLQPTTSATYRAVAGTTMSAPVQLLVLDRSIAVRAQRGRRRVLVRANVSPASPGGHVVLQLYLPDRFGWWPVRRARLDRNSSARFAVGTRRRLRARVVLTLPDGATQLAVSRTVRVGPR